MRATRADRGRRGGGLPTSHGSTLAAWAATLVLLLVAVSCMGTEDQAPAPADTPPASLADDPAPATTQAPPPSSTAPTPATRAEEPTTTTTTEPVRPTVFHVAPDGSDEEEGSEEAPWGTLSAAISRLQPGDTLVVHDGVYRERIKVDVTPASAQEPIVVRSAPGAEPVVEGLLWLRDPDHWMFEGINVTWDEEQNDDEEHMVKLTDGDHWEMRGAELWGARSFAALLIAGPAEGASTGWRVIDNCIHDTIPSNDTNEDHLLYVNSGPSPTDGLIENNLLFGAENGSGIKLGGSSEDTGGAHGVTVRNNTIINTAQPILMGWHASDNLITGNYFAGTKEGYGHIRGYQLEGSGNVAVANAGDDHEPFILNDEGFAEVEDGGDNTIGLELNLPDTLDCGLQPQLTGYGLETALQSMPSS